MITALSRLGPVEVAYLPFGGGEPARDLQQDERVTVRRIDASRGPRRLLAAGRALAAGAPKDLARAVSPELMAAARDAPAGTRVIADGPTVAAALLPLGRAGDAVYLAHNLETSFRAAGRELERFERKVLRTFHESWMATEVDIEGARKLAGDGLRLKYVPNVVDVREVPVSGGPSGTQNALFVADFSYGPNLEGLEYLVDQVMPLVWDELPEATVTVVGRGVENPPPDPRVRVLGFVADLNAAYDDADAVVVPLLTGGGSPLKLVDALARAMPVVATSHAARLMTHGSAPEQFLAAPDAPAMAAELVSVLRGEHPELGPRARALAEEHYSVEVLERLLGESATP